MATYFLSTIRIEVLMNWALVLRWGWRWSVLSRVTPEDQNKILMPKLQL